jgi:hypothetical protein
MQQTEGVIDDAPAGARAPECAPDATWAALVERRAARDRALTLVLPYRMGITSRPDGGWCDAAPPPFDALFELPVVVAESSAVAIAARELDAFRRTHHVAGFYGQLCDRVADGLVREDRAIERDALWLRREWESALATACNSGARARRWIADERRAWRLAVHERSARKRARAAEREREASEREKADSLTERAEQYIKRVRDTVGYRWVSAGVLLECRGAARDTIVRLRAWFDRVMLAMQWHKDARDAEDDRALFGASTADVLDAPDAALVEAAAHLFREAAEDAIIAARAREWCAAMERCARAARASEHAATAESRQRLLDAARARLSEAS